jgi:hypothetical protein
LFIAKNILFSTESWRKIEILSELRDLVDGIALAMPIFGVVDRV